MGLTSGHNPIQDPQGSLEEDPRLSTQTSIHCPNNAQPLTGRSQDDAPSSRGAIQDLDQDLNPSLSCCIPKQRPCRWAVVQSTPHCLGLLMGSCKSCPVYRICLGYFLNHSKTFMTLGVYFEVDKLYYIIFKSQTQTTRLTSKMISKRVLKLYFLLSLILRNGCSCRSVLMIQICFSSINW